VSEHGRRPILDACFVLAEHVVRARLDDLPAGAVAATRTFIQDTLGVAVAGSGGPWAGELVECLGGWGRGEDSRVLGLGTRLPAPAAALANAYQGHNAEFDCIHEAAVVHPMTAVLPAALAHAERRGGVSGQELLAAVALGVDVACHIGVASRAPLRFFRPATAGGFGATAAVGRLMGFDVPCMVSAMGIALGAMSGTMQAHVEGSLLLAMQVGFNARNALVACDLAARGLVGPREVLEGPFGYYRLFEGEHDLARVLADVGRVWRITEVAHKPFPSGRATHGVVDGVLELRRRHAFAAPDVDRVTARVPPLVHRLVGRPPSPDAAANQARLCAAYVAARALLRGTLDLDDFRPEALRDPATLALAQRIDLVPDANPDPNALGPVAVGVRLRDGRTGEITVADVSGSPARPLSRAAHLAKFRHNWTSGAVPLDEASGDRLIELVDRLESVRDVRALVDLAVPVHG
jgi:2-methylcitrate dehydratase PrpD